VVNVLPQQERSSAAIELARQIVRNVHLEQLRARAEIRKVQSQRPVRVDTVERAQANRLVIAAPTAVVSVGFLHPVVTATSVSCVGTTSSARFVDVCVNATHENTVTIIAILGSA
jgi:hypothetical protein